MPRLTRFDAPGVFHKERGRLAEAFPIFIIFRRAEKLYLWHGKNSYARALHLDIHKTNRSET